MRKKIVSKLVAEPSPISGEDYYNYHRPHGALDGQTPYERLLARKTSAGVLPKS
jgi:hypothetical protein